MTLALDKLQRALRDALLPIVRIAGEDTRLPMADRLAHYRCPAVGVAVIEDGGPCWAGGFGLTEAGGAPVDEHTVFAGASISKPLTAVLVMQQVEQGRLSLDEDVNRYLGAWKVPGNEYTRQRPVTLRHLMSHRAGTTVHGFGGVPPGAPTATVLDTLLGRAPAQNGPVVVDKTPGGSIRYSGGGYTVLQLVLEELCGQPFAAIAREMIFEPLGMSASSFETPLPPRLLARTASGHDAAGTRIPGGYSVCAQAAAGGVYLTPSDFARFMGAFRDAYVGRASPLMKPGTAREMVEARREGDFGLGWRVLGEGRSLRISHGGSNEGYQCETSCFLDSGQGAVVMTNAVSGSLLYWEVLNTIALEAGWPPGFLREPRVLAPLGSDERRKLAGRYGIVSGVDAPYIEVADRDGLLWSHIEGHRAPPVPVLMDQAGRLFNRYSPFDSAVIRSADGVAQELIVYDGAVEIIRARRSTPATAPAA